MESEAAPEPRLVRLAQCCKSRCGHVLIEDEFKWIKDGGPLESRMGTCPKCGGNAFYSLNQHGQARKQSDTSPREINPADIEPSPRMGLNMKRRILAAKRRALA